jgi:formiminotetrahydrofolate cyclodeaminase
VSSPLGFDTDEPLTGIVAAAAISAALALRVLRVVLDPFARKRSSERLGELIHEAENESNRLVQLAREDRAVYAAYLQARRERSPEVQAALRGAIETPLAAARSAASGLDLCGEALGFTCGAIAADVRGASVLLAGAVRAILCSVAENLGEVVDEAYAREVLAESERLRARVEG